MHKRLFASLALLLLLTGVVGVGSTLAQSDGTDGPTNVATDYLLPDNRILSYYGFPGNELMGILGEHDMETLLQLLRNQAAEYEAVDNSKPMLLAFEVIASVAQRDAGADGNYLEYTDPRTIQDYVDFTANNDLLLILDMQFGRNTVAQEIDAVREWLEYPHVHLAIDPEFSVREGEQPGVDLGTIDATDVRFAQEELAAISAEFGIPPKLLLVHQFNLYSISNREQIEQIPGVQYVLEVDGWGGPQAKRETYEVVGGSVPHEYYGFKLWYRQDEPLMTPFEVLTLEPSPDIVIYQ